MSKKKHKTVTRWVARLDTPFKGAKTLQTLAIEVTETAKQYRLIKDDSAEFRSALKACGYRTVINKSSDCPLFETEADALATLRAYHERQVSLAESRLRAARANLLLVGGSTQC